MSASERQKNLFNIRGSFAEGRSVYLDMQATTPTDPRVLDAMLPYMTQQVRVLIQGALPPSMS